MQEKDIKNEKFEKKPEECDHGLIEGVYDLGAQDGYICRYCGMRAQRKDAFHKNRS